MRVEGPFAAVLGLALGFCSASLLTLVSGGFLFVACLVTLMASFKLLNLGFQPPRDLEGRLRPDVLVTPAFRRNFRYGVIGLLIVAAVVLTAMMYAGVFADRFYRVSFLPLFLLGAGGSAKDWSRL